MVALLIRVEIRVTEEEKNKYEKEIKQEINKLLDDVYKAGEK